MRKGSKKGKPGLDELKARTRKPGVRKTTSRQRMLLVLIGLGLIAVLEIILRLLPVGDQSPAQGDPFVGFSAVHPLFIAYQADDGSLRMKTAPGKLIWFNPQDFKLEKGPSTFRIFTLGGSTTYGRPFLDATSFSGWLRVLLGRIPESSKRYEVINAGGISYASYRVVIILEELLQYDPDLFIIYTGHNEFLEARTYGDLLDQSSLVFKTREALSRLKLYRLLTQTFQAVKGRKGAAGGSDEILLGPEVQTLLDRSAGLDLYKRDTLFSRKVFDHFRYNISKIKKLCRQARVPVVFLDPVDNLKDFSPFKSEGRNNLDEASKKLLAQTLSEGFQLQFEGKPARAIEKIKKAVEIDSLNAHYFFFLGRAFLEAGDTVAAKKYLLQARELDVCPLRAQEPIHRILIEEMSGPDNPDILDLSFLFSSLSPGGPIGQEILIDHIHPYPEGNLRIALALLEWMTDKGFVPDEYFPDQEQLNLLYRKVIDSLPLDYARKGKINLARVLYWAGKFKEALAVLDSQWDQLHQTAEAQYLRGEIFLKLGIPHKTLEHYQEAYKLAPDQIVVIVELAKLYSNLGKIDSAISIYEKGLERYPDDMNLLTDFGLLQSKLGNSDRAFKLLFRAQRQYPDDPEININLGTAYLMAGQYERAIEAYTKSIDIDPDNPDAYYNLGNVYAVMNRAEKAEEYFLETIRRSPEYASAHINLGNIYANSSRLEQAEEQFQLALKYNPNYLAPYTNLIRLYQMTDRDSLASETARMGLQWFPGDSALKKLAAENASSRP